MTQTGPTPHITRLLNPPSNQQRNADIALLSRVLGGDGLHRGHAFVYTLKRYMSEAQRSQASKDAWRLDPSRPVPIVAWNVPMMDTDLKLPKLLPAHLSLTDMQFERFKQSVNRHEWATITGIANDFANGEIGTTFKYDLNGLEEWLSRTLRHPLNEHLTVSSTSVSL